MRIPKKILFASALCAHPLAMAQQPARPHDLCRSNEVTLWTCETAAKIYSLCSSRSVDRANGYFQYRAGTPSRQEFAFPAQKIHPAGRFEYFLGANGNASMSFKNGGYSYELVDDLWGRSYISIDGPRSSESSTVACKNGNQSLQENSAIERMKSAGLFGN